MRLWKFLPLLAVSAFFLSVQSHASDLALIRAKIYPSPDSPPIADGTIIIHDGHILAVGPSSKVKVPSSATVIDCKGLVVTAGFWNSHVHILTTGLVHQVHRG